MIYDAELEGRLVDGPAYKRWISSYEKAVKKAKKALTKSKAERFHPTTGEEFLKEVITHEIGHYAHRNYGMYGDATSKVLGSTAGRTNAAQLSEYAMKNNAEHFAEAFTEHIWLGGARNSGEVTSFVEHVIKANTELADFTMSMDLMRPFPPRK
mgnify:CR=1 FL=1